MFGNKAKFDLESSAGNDIKFYISAVAIPKKLCYPTFK